MRILLVDDSALIRSIIKQIFENDPDIQVVAEASNGRDAVEQAAQVKPDLIIMDVNMPVMDGIEATGLIMEKQAVPVLIFSSHLEPAVSFAAYKAGAVEVFVKPDMGDLNDPVFYQYFKELLLSLGKPEKRAIQEAAFSRAASQGEIQKNRQIRLVLLGASTGGPKAVKQILSKLPSNFKLPIALVQHLEAGFESEYVRWIGEVSPLKVLIAQPRQIMQPGHVYVAPVNRHIKMEGPTLVLDDGPKVLNQKPAVDVLFSSAAAYGPSVLAVLLTGMGRDGAQGCRDIIKNGGTTIVQDESSSAIFGMPRAAIELQAATYVMHLDEIYKAILKVTGD